MTTKLWLKKCTSRNRRGHYEISGDCGSDRIVVGIDRNAASLMIPQVGRELPVRLHAKIQNASRHKWGAGEARPVHLVRTKTLKYWTIALELEDLKSVVAV